MIRRETSLSFAPGKLSAACSVRGLTKLELATRLGMSPATMTAADNGAPLNANTVYRIAKLLDSIEPAPGLGALLPDEVA